MTEFIYLTKDSVVEMQYDLIEKFGGEHGIINKGVVSYAVEAPALVMYGTERYLTISEKAAILCYTLVTRHAFVDGNKRIGYVAMKVFLRLNDYDTSDNVDSGESMIIKIASGRSSLAELKSWIDNSITKI